jgi:hypothetical protein
MAIFFEQEEKQCMKRWNPFGVFNPNIIVSKKNIEKYDNGTI